MAYQELRGRGEFIFSQSHMGNSEAQGRVMPRDAFYLDGTVLSVSGDYLVEWTGVGPVVGILLGSVRPTEMDYLVSFIAREAEVETEFLLFPAGFERELAAAFLLLEIVARGLHVPADGATIAGLLGHVTGTAAVTIASGSTLVAADGGSGFNGYATDTLLYSGISQDRGSLTPPIASVWNIDTSNTGDGFLIVQAAGDHTATQAAIAVVVDGVHFNGAGAALFQVLGSGPSLSSEWAWTGATEFVDGSSHTVSVTL